MIREPAAGRQASSEAPKTPRFFDWLPETVNRVETHVSHRKQTIAHASTRDVPAHENFRKTFARESLEYPTAYPERSRRADSRPAALPRVWLGLQSVEGAPKISAFMECFGETGTVSKPGAARWALLFRGDFSAGSGVKTPEPPAAFSARLKPCASTVRNSSATNGPIPISGVRRMETPWVEARGRFLGSPTRSPALGRQPREKPRRLKMGFSPGHFALWSKETQ